MYIVERVYTIKQLKQNRFGQAGGEYVSVQCIPPYKSVVRVQTCDTDIDHTYIYESIA